MQSVEEDSCLVTLSSCMLSLHNPKAPVQIHDKIIGQLNELSEKFGYTLKTYNILALALIERGDFDKGAQIFETALQEQGIYSLFDKADDSAMAAEYQRVFQHGNHDLACLLYNYVKCNAIRNGFISDSYLAGDLVQFVRGDQ